jgi:hypothetical protein
MAYVTIKVPINTTVKNAQVVANRLEIHRSVQLPENQ